jgi:hypothetical protein
MCNETARGSSPDRLAIPALKSAVAELFQLKLIPHCQDPIDQLAVLALSMRCLAALEVGSPGLGLAHLLGLPVGPRPFDSGPIRLIAVRIVGPSLAIELALQAPQLGLLLV